MKHTYKTLRCQLFFPLYMLPTELGFEMYSAALKGASKKKQHFHDFKVEHSVLYDLRGKSPRVTCFLFACFVNLSRTVVNNTEEVGQLQTIDISKPGTTKWTLRDLEPLSKYKFHLRSCTTVGCGPIISEESTTTLEASESRSDDAVATALNALLWVGVTLRGNNHIRVMAQNWFSVIRP